MVSPSDSILCLVRTASVRSISITVSDTTLRLIVTSKSVCPTTVGQNIQLLWEQTDFDFTVGHYLVSGENSVRSISIAVSDTTHCLIVTSKFVCRTTVSDSEWGPFSQVTANSN